MMKSYPTDTWLTRALEAGLREMDNHDLLEGVAKHVVAEGVWTPGKIRPSLAGGECDLKTAKNLMNHGPQPGQTFLHASGGLPSSISNLHFTRGFLSEAVVITLLKFVAEEGIDDNLKVISHAPEFLVKHEDFEGHPDILIEYKGHLELIQVKSPGFNAFKYVSTPDDAFTKYGPQLSFELFITRKADIPVIATHLLLFTWDPLPATVVADNPHRFRDYRFPWTSEMEAYVLAEANRIRTIRRNAKKGFFPAPLPEAMATKFPCAYCPYPRFDDIGLVGCANNRAWQQQQP